MATKVSKVEQTRQEQGYTESPGRCGICKHRTFERKLAAWMIRDNERHPYYTLDRHGSDVNHRCSIGNFPVKMTASCARYEEGEAKVRA